MFYRYCKVIYYLQTIVYPSYKRFELVKQKVRQWIQFFLKKKVGDNSVKYGLSLYSSCRIL